MKSSSGTPAISAAAMAPGEMVPPRGGLVSADEVRGADHRRDADHEQQGPEQPAGGVGFPPWRSSRRRSNVNAWPLSG
jgi:hypothetical protein